MLSKIILTMIPNKSALKMHQDQEQVIGLWINLAATHKVPEKYVGP